MGVVNGGRLGAARRWAKVKKGSDRAAATAKARAAFEQRFADAPDPEAARRAYYIEIALRRHYPDSLKKAA